MTEAVTTDGHTPGPWGIEMAGNWLWITIPHTLGRKVLARLETGFNEPFESQQHANACLIAAAPDLLAALKACADSIAILAAYNQPPAIDQPALCEALAAIAKAEGKL